jgi:ribonuclease Y
METIGAIILGFIIGGVLVFVLLRVQAKLKQESLKNEVNRILNRARNEAAKIEKEAKMKMKEFETQARKKLEQELQKQKTSLKQQEQQLERKQKELEEQRKREQQKYELELQNLKQKDQRLNQTEKRLEEQKEQLDREYQQVRQTLERVSQLSQDEAKRLLMDSLLEEAKKQVAPQLEALEKQTEQEAAKRSRKIIAASLARFASEYVSEKTVTVLTLESEELKGKIIGREGRNIRTLESLCGVDLIVDDTPEAVVISSFDPIRRELAKMSIEKLLEDGRVHPARIEEVVEKQRIELQKIIRDEGEKVVQELGIGVLPPEVARLVGTMKFRYTQMQSLLMHSMEVAYLAGVMASELGEDVKKARRAGLLHDIGKCLDHTYEGSHAIAGAEFLRKMGESEDIVHAVRAHHNEEKPESILAHLVICANQISNARPGAKRGGMENFIKRHMELESLANSFEGVVRSYAVQAGHEVRVIVEASRVTEDLSKLLSRDILRKVEREMPHIQPLKVVVIRETRSVEFAR